MPKVSVIVPVYNTAPWLEECLNSVVNQTLRDLEIICIDDASTDASPDILSSFAERDDRVIIITLEQNGGQAHARNVGLDTATGEYIYFLDSDDSIVPDAMHCLYSTCSAQKLDIVFFDSNPIYDTPELKKAYSAYLFYRHGKYADGIYTGRELLQRFLAENEWMASVPRQFYSAEFLKENNLRFYEGIIHEDELFSYLSIVCAQRTRYITNRLFNRRFRDNSTMTANKNVKNLCGLFTAAYFMNKSAHQQDLYYGGVRSYIARLNNQVKVLFKEYGEYASSKIAGLHDPELMNAWYLFAALQDSYSAYGELSDALLAKAREYERIYIYGAGVVAKSVYAGLVRNDIAISGFVVTNAAGNPMTLEGHKVYEIGSLQDKKENSLFIIAIKAGKGQIGLYLEQNHFQFIYFDS